MVWWVISDVQQFSVHNPGFLSVEEYVDRNSGKVPAGLQLEVCMGDDFTITSLFPRFTRRAQGKENVYARESLNLN